MSVVPLRLEIVTPDGVAVDERGLDVVVVRRRERRFELGSEIAIYPGHAPLLVRLPVAAVRWHRGAAVTHFALGGGFAEVIADRVVIVTPRCLRCESAEAAAAQCDGWREEHVDLRYPVP